MIGEQPSINIDDLLADETVIADTAIKKGMAPIHSEVDAQEKIQVFVESILDRGAFLLTSEKGKDYEYKRDGSKLFRQKKQNGPWEDATEEAFKRQKKGWKLTIAPTENSAVSAEDPAQPTGEPVSVPMGVSSVQAEKLAKPEVSTDLSRALDKLRNGLNTSIDTIKTPLEYASFRKAHPDEKHFFHSNVVKNDIRRIIEPIEKPQVYDLGTELEKRTFEKFQMLKDADLQMQFDRENARITASKNKGDLDKLVEAWGKKLNVTFIWKDILHDLPEEEARIASTDYKECLSKLSHNFREKREELFLKPFQVAMDSIGKVCREKEETAKAILAALTGDEQKNQQENYDKFLSSLQSLWSRAERAFEARDIKELKRDLRAVNEVKFVVEEEKKKNTRPVVTPAVLEVPADTKEAVLKPVAPEEIIVAPVISGVDESGIRNPYEDLNVSVDEPGEVMLNVEPTPGLIEVEAQREAIINILLETESRKAAEAILNGMDLIAEGLTQIVIDFFHGNEEGRKEQQKLITEKIDEEFHSFFVGLNLAQDREQKIMDLYWGRIADESEGGTRIEEIFEQALDKEPESEQEKKFVTWLLEDQEKWLKKIREARSLEELQENCAGFLIAQSFTDILMNIADEGFTDFEEKDRSTARALRVLKETEAILHEREAELALVKGKEVDIKKTEQFPMKLEMAVEVSEESGQDAFFILPGKNAFGVFDGVGGASNGEEAASGVSKYIQKCFQELSGPKGIDSMKTFIGSTFLDADSVAKELDGFTTATVGCIVEEGGKKTLVVGNAGDSRIYVFHERVLRQVTLDDSASYDGKGSVWAREQQEKLSNVTSLDGLDSELQDMFNRRNTVSNVLGVGNARLKIYPTEVYDGDIVFASSDGVHDPLTDREMEAILAGNKDKTSEEIAKAFVVAVKERNNDESHIRSKPDDITIAIVKVK